jgi:hypothetical protein
VDRRGSVRRERREGAGVDERDEGALHPGLDDVPAQHRDRRPIERRASTTRP